MTKFQSIAFVALVSFFASCKTANKSSNLLSSEVSSSHVCQPIAAQAVPRDAALPATGKAASATFERSEFYAPTNLSQAWLDEASCGFDQPNASLGLAEFNQYAAVKAKAPYVSSSAYAFRPLVGAFATATAATLHMATATIETRQQAIASVKVADVMSAAAHLDLRDPKKVFYFANQIKEAKDPGAHTSSEIEATKNLMREFAKAPIVINVFTETKNGAVVINSIECTDGNHRLAAGLVGGTWNSIGDIPTEMVDIRVNGSRTADHPPPSKAEKDLHWLPERVADDPAFKGEFREISAEEYESRGNRTEVLGLNEFFRVPDRYGASGKSIALRPEVPSVAKSMGSNRGVPMWQVVRRTLSRDGIVAVSDFEADDRLAAEALEKEGHVAADAPDADFKDISAAEVENAGVIAHEVTDRALSAAAQAEIAGLDAHARDLSAMASEMAGRGVDVSEIRRQIEDIKEKEREIRERASTKEEGLKK